MDLVRNSDEFPLIHVDKLTPSGVMRYIASQGNQRTQKRLSKAAYGFKRSAIKHLVRCHLGTGWSQKFESRMEVLWKGFTRLTIKDDASRKQTKAKGKSRNRLKGKGKKSKEGKTDHLDDESSHGDTDDEDDDVDDREFFQQGKTPMSPELFKNICKWFLEWGTIEGIVCACFVVMTWHLACRSNNTARIRYSHLSWQYFDAMHINFRHTKTEQHGEAKLHKRACYSNPFEWYIDLPFLLGLYFATSFSTTQTVGMCLFPGGAHSQSARIGELLKRLFDLSCHLRSRL